MSSSGDRPAPANPRPTPLELEAFRAYAARVRERAAFHGIELGEKGAAVAACGVLALRVLLGDARTAIDDPKGFPGGIGRDRH